MVSKSPEETLKIKELEADLDCVAKDFRHNNILANRNKYSKNKELFLYILI